MPIPPLNLFCKYSKTIIGIDPGETVGVCVFRGIDLIDARQIICKKFDLQSLGAFESYIDQFNPDEIVIEDYRIYGWKTEEHSFAGLHTPKLIGFLICLCLMRNIPYTLRMAQPAKAFVTDEKLEAWGLWKSGHRHARDSMRHAIFQMIFPTKDISKPDT